MSDVGAATVCERARQVFVWTRAGFEDMELMGGEWGRSQERMEKAS